MEHTCPSCRHVVIMGAGGTGRCDNCGTIVVARSAQRPAGLPPQPAAAPPLEPPGPGSQPVRVLLPASRILPPPRPTRAASIVALVCGLLFFIPFAPAAVAIVFGLIAILRRRLPNERLAGAWVGLLLGVTAIASWLVTCNWTRSPAFTATFRGLGYAGTQLPTPAEEAAAGLTDDWASRMERAARAANDYRKDFRKWPESIEVMYGTFLSADFKLPAEVHYHQPPEGSTPQGWILLSSEPVHYSRVHEKLSSPHRLVIGIDSQVRCLPAGEVQATLEAQEKAVSSNSTPP